MSGLQIFRIGLWAVVALLLGVAVTLFFTARDGMPTASSEAAYGKPFRLVDKDGAEITEKTFQGRPSAVFFGFTHCPDVCPTTLFELAGYQKALKAEKKDIDVYFVTVDPERDTAPLVKAYVDAVSPDIKGLTGEPAAVADMLKGWGVYSRKVGEGADYSMDHTATTFLLDSAGRLSGTIAYQENAKTALEKLERLAAR